MVGCKSNNGNELNSYDYICIMTGIILYKNCEAFINGVNFSSFYYMVYIIICVLHPLLATIIQ